MNKKGLVGFELTGALQSWYVEKKRWILLVKFWSAHTTNSYHIIIVQILSLIAVTLDFSNNDCSQFTTDMTSE